jgi:glyoxylase I family protein
MLDLRVHHVSIVVTDLERSVAFYQRAFGLERLARPPFKTEGAWLVCHGIQIHLILYPQGTFRAAATIDNNDAHFSFHTRDFYGVLDHLVAEGFREDAEEGDPMRLFVIREGLAGFPQLYLMDPDRNIVEINGAP